MSARVLVFYFSFDDDSALRSTPGVAIVATTLPAESDSNAMFCKQSY